MFHIQRGFFSPLKRPPNHKHSNVTAECKPLDPMFVDESGNPSFAQENMLPFFCRGWHIPVLATCASAAVSLLAQVFC